MLVVNFSCVDILNPLVTEFSFLLIFEAFIVFRLIDAALLDDFFYDPYYF